MVSKKKILTFGYGNRTNYEDFKNAIEDYNISFVVDVRKRPRGWSAIWGASKLADFCQSLGIQYLSEPALGNDSGKSNWVPPNQQAADIAVKQISQISMKNNILLLCAEKDWHRCHRVEVSEHLNRETGNSVSHLGWKDS